MEADMDIEAAAAEEYRDFEALKGVALEQYRCIEGEDMDGLNRSLTQARGLMERIELRQRRVPGFRQALRDGRDEWARRCKELQCLLAEIDGLRRVNEGALTRWRERTRVQLAQVGKGGRSVGRGYGRRAILGPQLLDGVR